MKNQTGKTNELCKTSKNKLSVGSLTTIWIIYAMIKITCIFMGIRLVYCVLKPLL